ncbi:MULTISPECIES: hypothetical protein [Lactobacillus]|uniref:Uncharacterized protein n=1 Tax=Lactobacillus johnsonii TaxID=33959 RepID=A0A9X4X9H9_LACJH|nr:MULTISPECIES: hypothetical protein [Lactobacillus]MTE03574.1 hypothetical protein [Lactobacillus johnsonii]
MKDINEILDNIDKSEIWFKSYVRETDNNIIIKLVRCLPSNKSTNELIKIYKNFDTKIADKLLDLIFFNSGLLTQKLKEEIFKRKLNI